VASGFGGIVGFLMSSRAGTGVVVVVASFGCATVYTVSPDRVEGEMYEYTGLPQSHPRVFSGFVGDLRCIGTGAEPLILCILDAPLSLVADVLVLPWQSYQQVKYGNYHPRFVPEVHDLIAKQQLEQRRMLSEDCRRRAANRPDGSPPQDCDDPDGMGLDAHGRVRTSQDAGP
jgi:uncharacterized protein YceK